MKLNTKIAVLVLVIVVAAGIAFAQQTTRGGVNARPAPGMGMRDGREKSVCMGIPAQILRDLNLTQDQQTQLKELKDKQVAATAATRQQLKDAYAELKGLMTAENPDKDAIKRQFATIDALRADLRDSWIDFMFDAREILTPAQREKLRTELMNAKIPMGCGMGYGMGPGMGRGPGAGHEGACPRAGR